MYEVGCGLPGHEYGLECDKRKSILGFSVWICPIHKCLVACNVHHGDFVIKKIAAKIYSHFYRSYESLRKSTKKGY